MRHSVDELHCNGPGKIQAGLIEIMVWLLPLEFASFHGIRGQCKFLVNLLEKKPSPSTNNNKGLE